MDKVVNVFVHAQIGEPRGENFLVGAAFLKKVGYVDVGRRILQHFVERAEAGGGAVVGLTRRTGRRLVRKTMA